MWRCEFCGYEHPMHDYKCWKCNKDNPDFIVFNTEQSKKVEQVKFARKHINKLYNSIYRISDKLCEVRGDWEFDINYLENLLRDDRVQIAVEKKVQQLNHLKEMYKALDDYITDLYCQVEERLENMLHDMDYHMDLYNEWYKMEYEINNILPTLKSCSDSIYPLITYAESINAQKKGLTRIIDRISRFALNLQCTIDLLNDYLYKTEEDADDIDAANAAFIPEGTKIIAEYAFAFREELESVFIPASVETIGDYAFQGCESIKYITFIKGSNLKNIGESSFAWCKSLRIISIPEGVNCISKDAFWNCESLESINIPSTVTEIGTFAFCSCISLKTICFDGNIEQWNAIKLGSYWDCNIPATKVICSNGIVSL